VWASLQERKTIEEKAAGSCYSSRGQRQANRVDRMEWAGEFGGLGTLIPFVVA